MIGAVSHGVDGGRLTARSTREVRVLIRSWRSVLDGNRCPTCRHLVRRLHLIVSVLLRGGRD